VTALVSCNLDVAEYTALQMKKAITGQGRAAKSQVQEMVKRMLKLPSVPGPDAADALGLAITHAHASPSMNKLAALDVLNRKTHGMYRGGRSH
jgi:crossover junction endodeoxyribonuclease RuvC